MSPDFISFANICRLSFNLYSVYYLHHYSLHYCAYVRNNISCTRLRTLQQGKPDIFRVKCMFKLSTKLMCIFIVLSMAISIIPSSTIDKVYNKKWFRTVKTNCQSRSAQPYLPSAILKNLVKEPTYLDLFHTTHSYQIEVTAPLEHGSSGASPSCNSQHCDSVNWNNLRAFLTTFIFFRLVCFLFTGPSKICSLVTESFKLMRKLISRTLYRNPGTFSRKQTNFHVRNNFNNCLKILACPNGTKSFWFLDKSIS